MGRSTRRFRCPKCSYLFTEAEPLQIVGSSFPAGQIKAPRKTVFGRFLAEKRISPAWLAAQLGVTERTVRLWMQGTYKPTPSRIDALAFVLGLGRDVVDRMMEKTVREARQVEHETGGGGPTG